ncbi:wsv043 [White spot syndrome virus]|uniref:Wsv043 n=1 Tax=White spot syndrome virus TaxID=342409 RepID=K7WJ84_9VIRU|nr:wsv043 [White spot syndrome virus]
MREYALVRRNRYQLVMKQTLQILLKEVPLLLHPVDVVLFQGYRIIPHRIDYCPVLERLLFQYCRQ